MADIVMVDSIAVQDSEGLHGDGASNGNGASNGINADAVALMQAFVERAFARIRDAQNQINGEDWAFPEWLEAPQEPGGNRLAWGATREEQRPVPVISLAELRAGLQDTLRAYISQPASRDLAMLAALVAAGGGKTHAGVLAAQWAAEVLGLRVLWAANNHAMFDDLAALKDETGAPIFKPHLWYHFQSILNEDYCRHAKGQRGWLQRGYRAFGLCQQLCFYDRHIRECLYRLQAKRPERIVFAMHQHLTTGLTLSNFDLVIIDELPLSAFVSERIVPAGQINLGWPGAMGRLMEMLELLATTCQPGEAYHGRELFDWIGPILSEVYAEIEAGLVTLPPVPRVLSVADVEKMPYWYVLDLLRLAAREHKAWACQWPAWAERIKITNQRLHLLDRAMPWDELPAKTIVLDATAEPELYRQLFGRWRDGKNPATGEPTPVWEGREMEVYQPRIQRQGRVFQIVGRLNGKGSLIDETGEASDNARDLLASALLIARAYQGRGRVCVICHLALEEMFRRDFGDDNVRHFGAIRGTNAFQDAACVIVAGTPAPNPRDVIEIATALDATRIDPFVSSDGKLLYVNAQREYRVTDELRAAHDGNVPTRRVRGYWHEPQLQAIQEQLSKAELEQAIHRPRPNARACDVWVLSALPTSEPVDGIWDELPTEINGVPIRPEGLPWLNWLKLEPWLDARWQAGEPVSAIDVAALLGCVERHVRSQKWLGAIYEFQRHKWALEDDPAHTGKRGPKVQRLKPIEV